MTRSNTKPSDSLAVAALVPQGQHTGKQSMPIHRPLTVIGSRHRSHLHLLSRTVSKSHAVVGCDDNGVFIRDLSSRTHVFVNGKQIREIDLHHGDLVKIGSFTFKFTDKRKSPLLNKPKRPPGAAIEVEGSPLPIGFDGRILLIGRRPTCDISLMEMSVSTCHAVIFEHNGQRFIRDLGSRTGTFLNGQLIHQVAVQIGDQIRVGETDMKLVPQASHSVDELEDLVGTAPLGDEMLELIGEDLVAPPPPAKPTKASRPAATPPKPTPIPKPKPVATPKPLVAAADLDEAESAFIEKPLEPLAIPAGPIEEEIPLGPIEAKPIEAQAEVPPAEVLPAAAAAATEPAEPPIVTDAVKIDPEEPHLLVDANLYSDALTASGTFTGIEGEVEQANSEAALDAAATSPADLGLDFWHDEEPPELSPAAHAGLEIAPAAAQDEDEPLLLGVEEPGDSALGLHIAPPSGQSVEPAEPIAPAEVASATAPPSAEPEIPLELGPQLRGEEPPTAAASPLPGLVMPAAALAPAPALDSVPAAHAPAEDQEIDISAVQFTEPITDWEIDDAESTTAPAPLLDLGVTPSMPAGGTLDAPLELSHSTTDAEIPIEAAAETPAEIEELPEPIGEAVGQAEEPVVGEETETDAVATGEVPVDEFTADEITPLEPEWVTPEAIELEPMAESAAEPAESYSPLPLVEPISERQVALSVPEPFDVPVEEMLGSAEPTGEFEEALGPAVEAEPVDEFEFPVEVESEPVPDDLLEFNFDEPAEEPAVAEQVLEPGAFTPKFSADDEAEAALLAPVDESSSDSESASAEIVFSTMADAPIGSESAAISAPPSAPPADPVSAEPPPVAAARLNPFRGMESDVGSFIGGMPLPMGINLPIDDGSTLKFPKAPLAGQAAPLDVFEPPPELFDSEPETLDTLPDALEHIDDVGQVIGDRKSPPAGRPATPPPPFRPLGRGEHTTEPPPPFGSTPLVPDATEADIIASRKSSTPVSARRGQVTTAFDGLAFGAVRNADVFSQMNLPSAPEADAFGKEFGGSAPPTGAGAGNGSVPPPIAAPTSLSGALPELPNDSARRSSQKYLDRKGLRPNRATRTDTPADPDLIAADPSTGDFAGVGVEQRASMDERRVLPAQQINLPSQFPTLPPMSMIPHRRSRVHVGILLPLMLVIAAGLAAAIWFLTPVTYSNRASLAYTNLDKMSELQRTVFLGQQEETLASPDLLTLAQQIYVKDGGKAGVGFLYPSDSQKDGSQLAKLVANIALPPGKNTLQFQIDSSDGPGDAIRLNALLHALHVKDAKLTDQAGRINANLDAAQTRLRKLTDQITTLDNQIRAESQAVERLRPMSDSYAELNDHVAQLLTTWQSAARHFNDAQREVHYLETTGAGVTATQPAQAAPDASNDPETRDLSDQIAKLQSSLDSAHSAQNSTADQASKALDDALTQFGQKVSQAQSQLKNGSALGDYLSSAQQAQDAIVKLRAEFAQQQKANQEQLKELKDKLAATQEAHIKNMWASDPQLHDWEQDLEIQQHHYQAALGSGLNDDAQKIKVTIDKLVTQIASRRDQLSSADPDADDVATIGKFVDDWLDRMNKEQSHNDQRIDEQMQLLSSVAPNMSKLPDDQKALAADLERQQAQLDKARQQYALALQTGPQAETNAKNLELQLAELKAKVSARRREVEDENRKNSSEQEEKRIEAQLAEKNLELTAAQQSESSAYIEWWKYNLLLANAKTDMEITTAQAARLSDDSVSSAAAHAELDQANDDVTSAADLTSRTVVPVAPPDDAVETSAPLDHRWQYMLVAVFTTLIVFCPMIFLAARGHEEPRMPSVAPPRPAGEGRSIALPRPARPLAPSNEPMAEMPQMLTSLTAALEPDPDGDADAAPGSDPNHNAIPAGF